MGLVFPRVIAIQQACWACKGTGFVFAGASPIRFRKCGMCLGICGRGPERQEKAPGDEAEGQ